MMSIVCIIGNDVVCFYVCVVVLLWSRISSFDVVVVAIIFFVILLFCVYFMYFCIFGVCFDFFYLYFIVFVVVCFRYVVFVIVSYASASSRSRVSVIVSCFFLILNLSCCDVVCVGVLYCGNLYCVVVLLVIVCVDCFVLLLLFCKLFLIVFLF